MILSSFRRHVASSPERCSSRWWTRQTGTVRARWRPYCRASCRDARKSLLRESRRALHARIAAVLDNQFAEIAESQPELLARHATEAGLIEKAELQREHQLFDPLVFRPGMAVTRCPTVDVALAPEQQT